MRAGLAVLISTLFAAGPALAQTGAPSGRGAVTGDPRRKLRHATRGSADHGDRIQIELKRQRQRQSQQHHPEDK